jgi:hypothetical protein
MPRARPLGLMDFYNARVGRFLVMVKVELCLCSLTRSNISRSKYIFQDELIQRMWCFLFQMIYYWMSIGFEYDIFVILLCRNAGKILITIIAVT